MSVEPSPKGTCPMRWRAYLGRVEHEPRRRRGSSTARGPLDRARGPLHRAALASLVGLGVLACSEHGADRHDAGPGAPAERTIEIVARTPHLATYPCGPTCHDEREPNPTPRALTEFHAGRETQHGPAIAWCGSCHALDEVDSLVLLDRVTRVSFDDSADLCAQCHGPEHADWEEGVHGLSTGGWRGIVRRRTCTACHDPHAPGAIHLEALPAPADEREHAEGGDEPAGGHATEHDLPEEAP